MLKPPAATFWDQRYGTEEYAYGREPNDFLREEAQRIPAGPVLCLAEGEGRNAVYLAGRGHEVTAIDFSVEGLRKAERLAWDKGAADSTGGPKDPSLLMTLQALREELAPLDIVIGREVERDIHEGPFHGGPSATVQIVAVRR